MDKELKIAVARPAFKSRESLIGKIDLIEKPDSYFKRKKSRASSKTTTPVTTTADTAQYYDQQGPTDYYDDQYDAVSQFLFLFPN